MGWRMIVGPSVGGEGTLVVGILAQKGATARRVATNLWAESEGSREIEPRAHPLAGAGSSVEI